jgi:hypothetical protein
LLIAAGVAAAVLGAAGSTRAADVDKLTPNDSEALVFVNVRQILDSPLFKKHGLDEAKKALASSEEANKALKGVGLDPFQDVDSLQITANGGAGADGRMLIVAHGNFELAKIKAAAETYAKANTDKLKISKEGEQTVYEAVGQAVAGQDGTVFSLFTDAKTMLASNNKDYLLTAAAKKNTGAPGKALNAVLGKVTGKESMFMALTISESTKKQLAGNKEIKEIADKLDSATITLDLANDAQAAVNIFTTDPKAASDIKVKLNQVKGLAGLLAADPKAGPIVQELVDNLKITTEMNAVKMSIKVTEEMIDKAGK